MAKVLDRAVAWWHADKYSGSGDWLDESGNSHDAQFGSTSGADSNDPMFLEFDERTRLFVPEQAVNNLVYSDDGTYANATDIELIARLKLIGLASGYMDMLASYATTASSPNQADMNAHMYVTDTGYLTFRAADGTTRRSVAASVTLQSVGFSEGDKAWIRVTWDYSADDVKFWYALGGSDNSEPSWTQLGTTQSLGTTNAPDAGASARIWIGGTGYGNTQPSHIYRLIKRDDPFGTPVTRFDWDTSSLSPGDASDTPDTGSSVTIYRGSSLEPLVVNRNLMLLTGDDYFEVADHADLDLGSGQSGVLYAVFRKITDFLVTQAVIDKGSVFNTTGWGFEIGSNENPAVKIRNDSGSDYSDNPPGGLITNSLEHGMGGVYDQSGLELTGWKNEAESGSPTTITNQNVSNAEPMRLGASSFAGAGAYFQGVFVGMAVFKEVLSDADMATLDKELKANHTGTVLDGATAWWHADRYDPDTDTDWEDQSGNSHDAQLGSTSGADSNDPTFIDYATEGEQCFYCPTPSTNFVAGVNITDDVNLRITGDQEVHIDCALDDWVVAGNQEMYIKRGNPGSDYDFVCGINNGNMFVRRRASSTDITYTSSAAISFTDGVRRKLRYAFDVDNGASASQVRFYWRVLDGDSWTELGTAQTDPSTTVTDGGAEDGTGTFFNATSSNAAPGRYYDVKVYSDLGSTLECHLDFVNTSIATGATSFTESSSNATTVNIYRGSGNEGAIVNRNMFYLHTDDFFEVADHANLDFGLSDDLSLMAVTRNINDPSATGSVICKKDSTGSGDAGYNLVAHLSDYYLYQQSDGTNQSSNATADFGAGGVESTGGAVRNTTDDDYEAFLNGTGSGSPTTDTSTGTLANARPLRMGANSNSTPAGYVNYQYFVAAAVFREALSDNDVYGAHLELLADQTPTTVDASITGDVTLSLTPDSTTVYGAMIEGDVTLSLTPAATLKYGAVIEGDVTLEFLINSTMVSTGLPVGGQLVSGLEVDGLDIGDLGMDGMMAGSQSRKWR
jgi:hypothetical protein